MDQEKRIVVLIDMDCFYCQVEEKLNPELSGKPIAVVQYNPWKGGGIIAVNYVARAMGVTRHMRGDEAKEKCPEINLPSVPCQRGKADISKYREAGKDVAKVLQRFTPLLERASIDEAYLDITEPVRQRMRSLNTGTITSELIPNTYALGYDGIDEFITDVACDGRDALDFDCEHARRLLVGAVIVSEIRAAVYEETGYRCSAGVAHNKILAKLVCGMNKPNKQTVLPKHSVNILYRTLPVKKVKHLGGKFGDLVCESLRIKYMADLQQFSEKELQSKFDEKNGTWLYNIARGMDSEPVQARFNPKSIGCCKQLRGKSALTDLNSLRKWLKDLGDEIEDRLETDALENNRTPKQMVVSFSLQMADGRDCSSSRSYNFTAEDELCGELFSSKALELLLESAEGCKVIEGECNRKLKSPIKFLGISVGKFEDHNESKKTKKIVDYFAAGSTRDVQSTRGNLNENVEARKEECKNKADKEYIMKKFFNVDETYNSGKSKEKSENLNILQNIAPKGASLQSTLDKQESFFAKFLNSNSSVVKTEQIDKASENRVTTPVCNVIACGDDSNDTDYSGSTINAEINKSIALFEEDPDDVARVSNMRNLLSHSEIIEPDRSNEILHPEPILKPRVEPRKSDQNKENIDQFMCTECSKTLPIAMYDEHTDYHVALKLRDEERQEARKEMKERSISREVVNNNKEIKNKKQVTEEVVNRNESVGSIANFLTKLDRTVPSSLCTQCNKRVPDDKFMEHSDFHEAQKLSRQINNKTIITSNSSSVKRKRSTSPIRKPKVPCKSIDLFFR